MFLLKCTIKGLSEFQSIFNNERELRSYLSNLNQESIEKWSIHPLTIENPIASSERNIKTFIVLGQPHGGSNNVTIARDVPIDDISSVLDSLDIKLYFKIFLIPSRL